MNTPKQDLGFIKGVRKSGAEPFHINGKKLPETLLSFWQWSSSGLMGNALRGMLAEFIVATDLGCAGGTGQQWNAYDLVTPDGVKVEVKSAAYLQNWSQKKLSTIQFGIRPALGWDVKTQKRSETRTRLADVYVFCLLKHKDKESVDPLNMAQWDFYILSTEVLDKNLPGQKTLSLRSLKRLNPSIVSYGQIGEEVKQQARRR